MLDLLKTIWKRYKLPTPAKWRNLGNALVLAAAAGTVWMPYISTDKMLLRGVVLALFIGKFITEFATDKHD